MRGIRTRRGFTGTRIAGVGLGCVAAVALLGGCANIDGSPRAANTEGTTTSSAPPTTTVPPTTQSSTDLPNAGQLCQALEDQFQEFRTYGANMGRLGLNASVLEWAARNNINIFELFNDGSSVDAALEEACPQVRAQTLDYLNLTTIDEGLVGPN